MITLCLICFLRIHSMYFTDMYSKLSEKYKEILKNRSNTYYVRTIHMVCRLSISSSGNQGNLDHSEN